jgi:hypothetical protein
MGNTGGLKFTAGGFLMLSVVLPLQCIGEELLYRSFTMQTAGSWVNPLHLIQRIRWSFQSLCASDFPTADTAECTDIYSEETYIPSSPNNSRVL